MGLDRGHFLSAGGNCNPFDDAADGYCRADAVGSVVLKRLEDAIVDRDPIYGVIAGSSTNHCGQTVSITRPHQGDQLALFRRILRNSNTDPTSVSYVEMHGTGTQAGDAAEMSSVLSAFAWDHRRTNVTPNRPLHLGAVKANVGHSESGSGVTALIKTLLMMKHAAIPPHRLDGKLNHHYPSDMAQRNVHIAFKLTPWRREDCPGGKRVSFLNNFSAAGGNTALLLEDAPQLEASDAPADPRSVWPVAISAKTTKALEDNFRALISFLDGNQHIPLPALSYTTTARRVHHKFRILVSGADTPTLKAALQSRADELSKTKAIKAEPPKMVFMFTGQGSFYIGIGKQLFEHVSLFRTDILRFNRIAEQQGFPSFLSVISGSSDGETQAADPVVAHLAFTSVQMALSHLWTTWIGESSAVIGHSLGEYAALYASGAISASDAIHLVGSRARLLATHCTPSTHAMLAVKAPLATVTAQLSGSQCTVACINSPVNIVVSGPKAAIETLSETFKSRNLDVARLEIPYAFHSAQVDPILTDFEAHAGGVQFHKPAVPFMSPLLSDIVNGPGLLNSSYVVRATRECVNFNGAINAAREAKLVNDSTLWVEIGSHPACSGMIKQIIGSQAVTVPTLRKDSDCWKVLTGSIGSLYLAGTDVHWDEFHRGFEAAQQVLPLPNYRWDLKNYWIQYRHNFCLTKGDDPATFAPQPSPALQAPPTPAPPLSASVHRVLEENSSSEVSTLLTESELHDPRLAPILAGHKVNTAMLCPSSLYADMALTIAKHMLKAEGFLNDKIGLNCAAMSIQRPLISQPDATSQLLKVSAKADWSTNEVSLRFFSVNAKARKIADHATCTVHISEDQNWMEDWKRNAYLVSSRISLLRQAVDAGAAHKIKRGLAYKLFSSLVDYSSDYQGMEQVILDSGCLEATAQVRFQVDSRGFDWNPCWIDSLGHIAGFIMNGNDNVASMEQVFVNHGWEAMRCARSVEAGKTYTTYNRMQLESGTMYAGDTYVFDGQDLIAIFEGVRVSESSHNRLVEANLMQFQGVNRSVLDQLLPNKAAASKSVPSTGPVRGSSRDANTKVSSQAPAVAPKPKTTSTTTPKQPDKVASALKIVAEEVQFDPNEVDSDTEFVDVGVDSLLSLTIISRLNEELGLEVPASVFDDNPTIGAFTKFIGRGEVDQNESAQPSSTDSSTPSPSLGDDDDEGGYSTGVSSVDDNTPGSGSDIMALIRKLVSEETGTTIADISADSLLVEIGIDSLLGLTIMGALSEQIDAELPSGLLLENDTLNDVEAILRNLGVISKPKKVARDKVAQQDAPLDTAASVPSRGLVDADELNTAPYASSLLLPASSKAAKRSFFLFPDGAGSATSYSALPEISADFAVYGLNCPWLKTPQDLKCSLEHYTAKFLVEIRRRQPHGPYYFGGWSAGGILAYEAAQQLERVGEKVARLVLLDSPNPVGLENPNQRFYEFMDSVGMLGMGGGQAPAWLRAHFDAFLAMLDGYKVQKFIGNPPPTTHMIYARDGLCKNDDDPRPKIRPDDPREMLWLLNNRTDFSGAGWKSLLGTHSLHVAVLDDVNHFTLVQPGPKVKDLSALIGRALRD